ncbi:MAG: transcriptional regulator [Actinomycetota bacterium]|nr:transcriptional regulator [Actinomycetota bacterium]
MSVVAVTAPRHQQLIVSVFGLYRELRGGIPIAALIRMLGELGVEPASVRSSVSRLKKRGILVSTTVDGTAGYALSPEFDEVFREGDRRIFSRHAVASDQWLLATFTVPESQRHLRHRIRIVLGRLGFGSVAAGLWIAPAGVTTAVRSRLAREQLDGYVEFFTAQYTDTGQLKAKVASWWDLDSLEGQYQGFVQRHAAQRDAPQLAPGPAFNAYVPLVTEWRQLPYLDPGLPAELLPVGWHGRVAEDLFMRLHQRWSAPSRQHAESLFAVSR